MSSYQGALVGGVVGRATPFSGFQQPYAQTPAQPSPEPAFTEDDIKQVQEMFPNVDAEVIKSVFVANRGNKPGTINSLLQMAEQ